MAIKKDGTKLGSGVHLIASGKPPIDFRNIELLNLERMYGPQSDELQVVLAASDNSACTYKKK